MTRIMQRTRSSSSSSRSGVGFVCIVDENEKEQRRGRVGPTTRTQERGGNDRHCASIKSNDDNEEKREQQHFPGTVLPVLFRGRNEKFKVNLPVRL